MVSGRSGDGEPGLVEVRRLLALAAADDDARSAALDALCERSVVAPTLSGSGDALRTLTNANGDKAMPLFSGKDTLQAAAKRFGWSSGDGAPAMRELSAREAMQSALVQGVQFVVFDVGAAHCVEFAGDEVALMLAVKQSRQRPPASASPSRNPKPVVTASARKPRVPTAERGGMSTAPSRPGARGSPPTSAVTSPGFVFDPGERTSGAPLPPRTSAAPPAVFAGTRAVAPLPSVRPIGESNAVARPTIRPGQRGAVSGLPSVHPMQSDGFDALPSAGTLPGASVELLPSPAAGPGDATDSLVPVGPVSSPAPQDSIAPRAPRVKPTGQSAVRPPSLSAPVDPIDSFGQAVDSTGLAFAPSASEAQPETLATESDALPTVESHADATPPRAIPPPPAATEKSSLKQMAKKGMDDVAGRSFKTAAKALAAILGNESSSDKRAVVRAVVPEEPEQATSEDDAQPDEPDLPDGALRPLEVGLSDPMQGAIADALRAYPEVEWACEVSDGSDLPVVAVRVSPAFTSRVAEIEAAVIKAASTREVSLRVLHLSDPAVMREARTNGNTFFPWRKRPNRK